MELLDIDTGGGEFLLSLKHPFEKTSATEAYPPNVKLCENTLLPLGIDFRAADGKGTLPFDDYAFDMVIDRHGDFNAEEIYRILKAEGLFVTQQVGAENDRELVELLLPQRKELPFPEQYVELAAKKFRDAGFEILDQQESFQPIRFFDVGALVWFAHIISGNSPDFLWRSVWTSCGMHRRFWICRDTLKGVRIVFCWWQKSKLKLRGLFDEKKVDST